MKQSISRLIQLRRGRGAHGALLRGDGRRNGDLRRHWQRRHRRAPEYPVHHRHLGQHVHRRHTQVPFDPAPPIPDTCSTRRVYYRVRHVTRATRRAAPTTTSVPLAAFKCHAAPARLRPSATTSRRPPRSGARQGQQTQWNNINGNTSATAWVECQRGCRHAWRRRQPDEALGRRRQQRAPGPRIRPKRSPGREQSAITATSSTPRTTSTGCMAPRARLRKSRLAIVKQVATSTINQLAASQQRQRGADAVQQQHERRLRHDRHFRRRHGAARNGPGRRRSAALLTADIAALNADGCTPLSESMYEAYLYLSGGSVDYGINSRKSPADSARRAS